MKIKSLLFLTLFICQISQAQMPNALSAADKVYGLSKFWQEVNYNFIYFNRVDRQVWDSTYRAMIMKVQDTKNDYEYYHELERFCATLNDGHTNIWYPKSVQDKVLNTMFGDYRLFIKNIDGKAIITTVIATKKDEMPIGSEIIEVNGLTTKAYINQFVRPYISSSTDYVLEDLCHAQLLQGLEGSTFIIKIKTPKGVEKSFTLTHKRTEDMTTYPPSQVDSLLEFKWLENQIAYVALNSFGDDKINRDFEKILPELYKAKALIIDLRKNGGGMTGIGTGILKYLTNDKIIQRARYQTREHLASFKAWGAFLTPKDTINNAWNTKCYLYNKDQKYYSFDYSPDTFDLSDKRIVVPTAVLIGHSTASAAEDFLISADNQKHFTKIGENSFGSTGQPFQFDMPGGGGARICTKKDTYPDGREFVGFGIKPDIEVKQTVEDYMTQKDRVLEKASAFLKAKLK
jgi:C-terminal processing protease CtpA/Prc